MRKAIVALALLLLAVSPAHARHHHRHHRHHHARATVSATASLVTVSTAAGIKITVATDLADRFKSLIADFVEHGYRPRHIGCFARSGHVRHSLHYLGRACDFDQVGWGKTARFMYTETAHRIILAHGFRDGRAFRDQGHVDDGRRRYAGY
jgi:hypothetical protein